MDFDTLLSIRASKFDDLESLYKLQFRFSRYIEVLRDFENDVAEDEELHRAQQELLRLLKYEGHRFYERVNGERVRSGDVVGLAESPAEYLETQSVEDAVRRATATFERLIEEAKHALKEVDSQVALVRSEARQTVRKL